MLLVHLESSLRASRFNQRYLRNVFLSESFFNLKISFNLFDIAYQLIHCIAIAYRQKVLEFKTKEH